MGSTLHVAFFADFKGCDSVLFAGDTAAMQALADVLAGLAGGQTHEVRFEELPFVKFHRSVSILARQVPQSRGIRYADQRVHWSRHWSTNVPEALPCFSWDLSAEEWDDVREKVLPLLGGGGHQYVASHGSDVEVVIAANEYGEAWWAKHG